MARPRKPDNELKRPRAGYKATNKLLSAAPNNAIPAAEKVAEKMPDELNKWLYRQLIAFQEKGNNEIDESARAIFGCFLPLAKIDLFDNKGELKLEGNAPLNMLLSALPEAYRARETVEQLQQQIDAISIEIAAFEDRIQRHRAEHADAIRALADDPDADVTGSAHLPALIIELERRRDVKKAERDAVPVAQYQSAFQQADQKIRLALFEIKKNVYLSRCRETERMFEQQLLSYKNFNSAAGSASTYYQFSMALRDVSARMFSLDGLPHVLGMQK